MRYLNKTSAYALKVKAEDNAIRLFPDAAFAPSGAKSHSGFLVMWGNTPIVWRSARQATVALSTAESELNAILEGGIAVLGLESMLYDLNIHVEERVVLSDSMSALTISSGTGSWRTRHLRIKASWLQEMLTAGSFTAKHCPGVVQPADLLTKALPSQRLCDLLELWGVGEVVDGDNKSKEVNTKAQIPAAKMLVAMLCCVMFLGTEARDLNDNPGPQIDYDMMGILVILLVVLGGLIVYEAVKWVCLEFYREWTPGASRRKLRRSPSGASKESDIYLLFDTRKQGKCQFARAAMVAY
ncbi:Retrovirus-related Pol polyprotein from transposon TNT 1-94 [Symbiodinium microadriaticum]|uniref:Retrovirus-related Pol polyprotein from transposon TNT 1-94 n=1 Tax=Symbiodinium microadriaticum TaxID=2951 RepID=A0A1Q9F3Q3_SYMMI|nr:Retrovirus-related Pol polyprotein from transposon TNT 1-94 [Symbiodinium microadriaticum]